MKNVKPLPTWESEPTSLDQLKARIVKILKLGWTAGPFAVDKSGREVFPDQILTVPVCKVCIAGARMLARCGTELRDEFDRAFMKANGTSPIVFNECVANCASEVIAAVRKVRA